MAIDFIPFEELFAPDYQLTYISTDGYIDVGPNTYSVFHVYTITERQQIFQMCEKHLPWEYTREQEQWERTMYMYQFVIRSPSPFPYEEFPLSEDIIMAITYPSGCNTPAKKMEWLCAAQELLRYIQNLMGYWHRNSITQAQYDNPPLPNVPTALKPAIRRIFTYLKNRYPYRPQLTREDWDRFYRENFQPWSDKITAQKGIQDAQLKVSTTWDVLIEDI